MHYRIGSAALAALTLVFVSCSDSGPMGPAPLEAPALAPVSAASTLPSVRIAEFHYDDEGTDAGEKIEISAPANTSLKGWKIVLYNGSATQRVPYSTITLGDVVVQASCGSRGVHVVSYGVNGIQNGASTANGIDPDGIALVDPNRTVVEFLSYEGAFTAAGTAPTDASPAAGMTSVDIGVRENGEPDGQSLKRDADGVWSGPTPHNFETCNDAPDEDEEPVEVARVTIAPAAHTMPTGASHQFSVTAFDASDAPVEGVAIAWQSLEGTVAGVSATGLVTANLPGTARIVATAPNGVADTAEVTVEPPAGLASIRFTEIHYDNASFDQNEALEIEGPANANVSGWTVVLYNGNGGVAYHTRALPPVIPQTCEGGVARGVVVLNYPADSVQNGPDGFALVDAAGEVIEFLSYEGVVTATDGPAAGMVSTDIGVAESSTTSDRQSLKRNEAGAWAAPANASDVATFGRCNRDGPVPPAPTVTITGRGSSDPALPVGFEDQLFATRRDANGVFTPTTFTWSVDTPDLARVENGHVRALGAGTAIIRATAADGTTGTFSLRTQAATPSATARYQPHAEFGEPADGDASDDYLVRMSSYTASYNPSRGTANWVSYNLEATHFGTAQRCDCFTHDAAFPAGFTRLTTADYTNSSDFHGFDIDRGHLVRSADRDAGVYDNASTFFFTNIIPQARENNQGPWGDLEDTLAVLAQTRELFVIAGVAGSRGWLKGVENRIMIPAITWKVAVILPADRGLADVRSLADLEVIAVSMPNDASVAGSKWREHETTVDAIEATSGYDLLALLPDQVEIAVESRTRPPVAVANGPYAGSEGASVTLSAAGSTDPDGDALEYAWSFGDGATGNGASVSHTWAQDGEYTVTLTVTDSRGLTGSAATTAQVANVPPAIGVFAGATLLPGERYSASGTFTDPGADAHSATVDYGDGSGVQTLALNGNGFSLSHRYAAAGTYTVTVRVGDDDASTARTSTVTVLTPAQGVAAAIELAEALSARGLNAGEVNALVAKLSAALRSLGAGGEASLSATLEPATADGTPAINQLNALLQQLDAITQSRRLTSSDAAPLRSMVERVIATLAGA